MDNLHGGDIYTYQGVTDFSVNVNPLGPSPAVLEAAGAALSQSGAYPDCRCRGLRSALSRELEVPEDMLIFGNGAADLIFSLVFALKPKKAVLCAPSFSEYERALKAAGCEISWYHLKEEKDFCLCPDYLDCLTEETDLIFLCTPDNPAGNVIAQELFVSILKKCREMGISAVVDECFCEFLDDQDLVPGAMEALAWPELFLLRAFTKIHALPGLRLGYGITADPCLIQKLQGARQPWSVSIPAQAAGRAALFNGEWTQKAKALVNEERKRLMEEFDRLGIRYFPSKANYILLKSPYDLFTRLLKKQLLIRDCSNYRGLRKGFYRTAVKTREENDLLLGALREIYEKEGHSHG